MKRYFFAIITLMVTIFSPCIFAQSNDSQCDPSKSIIQTDIKNSYSSLQKLTVIPASIVLRKHYLTQLQKLIDDFHYLSSEELNFESKKALDLLALKFMSWFNGAHKIGTDLDDNFGSGLFTDINNDTLVKERVIPDVKNKGTESLTVNIEYINPCSDSLSNNYKLKFDAANHYLLIRMSDSMLINSGTISETSQSIKADGFVINLTSNGIVAGDEFAISPSRHAASNIQLLISDPELLALAWPVAAYPVTPQQPGSTGKINVINITDPTSTSFTSRTHTLTPPILVKFTDPLHYYLYNATTMAIIEGPINYSSTNFLFPTPGNYDPGYSVTISGLCQSEDKFIITYNTAIASDNRNAYMMAHLYNNIASCSYYNI